MRRFRLAPYLRRTAIYHGLFGGNRFWLVVLGLIWLKRSGRKILGREPQFVTLEKLQPGQSMVLTAIGQATREQRRAARRRPA